MRHLLYGFAAGALLLALPWPLPPGQLFGVVLGAAVLVAALLVAGCESAVSGRLRGRREFSDCGRWLALLAGAVAGLGWSAWSHEALLAARVQPGGSGHAVPLVVRLARDPAPVTAIASGPPAVRFLGVVEQSRGRHDLAGRRLRFSWYGAEPVARGETWRVAAVVRPPWGYANPGGFDYERWLTGQGIHGTGTIRRGIRETAADAGAVQRMRAQLAAFVESRGLRHGPVLTAQLVGITAGISRAQWETFRVTGTIHLMVISGLHIALAAAMGFAVGRWACRLCPVLFLWLDARKWGAGCGVLCASGYLAMAGGGLPALRACVMAAPALLLLAWGRRCRAGSAMLVGLAVILGVEPLAVHQQGFWLSFGAVAVLVFGFSGRHGPPGTVAALLRAQWLLTLCIAPLLTVLIGAIPLSGMVANLVAVPAVSALVVPLTLGGGLLAGVWPAAAGLCLWAADGVLVAVFAFLEWCARAPVMYAEPGAVIACIGLCAGVFWLFGGTGAQRVLLLLCIGSTLLPPRSDIAPGGFRVLVLDVGQGDAIVVDTARHRLLFDTGPAFPGGFETGSAVVVPSLLATGPGAIDVLVLSHADLDHVGGAPAVAAALPVGRIHASFPWPQAAGCRSASWTWDGVSFRFLDLPRPGADDADPGRNDDSCVLLVDDGRRRALLAGDIGAAVEGRLLRSLPGPVDLLLAPHHGSLTSSSRAFVRFARPRFVFVSAGRDNRYGHPHPRVLERYQAVGATVRETARSGALRWESRAPGRSTGLRDGRIPYWRGSDAAAAGN